MGLGDREIVNPNALVDGVPDRLGEFDAFRHPELLRLIEQITSHMTDSTALTRSRR